MACLLFSAAYGAVLRSILMSPLVSERIETMQDVVDSGLPWDFVLYGEQIEIIMATSDDPLLKALWEGMNFVQYTVVLLGGKG